MQYEISTHKLTIIMLVDLMISIQVSTLQGPIITLLHLWFTNTKQKKEKMNSIIHKRPLTFYIHNTHVGGITRCHVVSHWEDRNMITTILLFELTVASHQRMTVKNRCLYSVTSLGSPDTGRKKVEAKWLAGTPKRKRGLLPVSGNR